MNISPISYAGANYNNNNVHNVQQNVSFCGGKTAFAEKAGGKVADSAGCAFALLQVIVLSPLILPAVLLENTKKNKVDSLVLGIKHQYEAHPRMHEFFERYISDMNKHIDKYAKNENYSQFVKDALAFLKLNYEKEITMEPFIKDGDNTNWFIFMQAINDAAKMAISKNGKGIDKEKLDKYIQVSREIMRQAE